MFSGGASPEPGVDPDVVARHVGDQDAVLLVGALADQPLAEAELGPQAAPLAVGVGAAQLQHRRRTVGLLHHVEDAVLRRDDRGELGEDQLGHRPSGRAGPGACG